MAETEARVPTTSDFHDLIGEDLSGVTFVRDYVQLEFNPPPRLSAYTPVSIQNSAGQSRLGDPDFANMMIAQIGQVVAAVALTLGEALVLTFEDGSTVAISLREGDYVGPEAVYYTGKTAWTVL
jgi:hypothetical protein